MQVSEASTLARIELALRRVSSRLKSEIPWDPAVTKALDELAEELCAMDAEAQPPRHKEG